MKYFLLFLPFLSFSFKVYSSSDSQKNPYLNVSIQNNNQTVSLISNNTNTTCEPLSNHSLDQKDLVSSFQETPEAFQGLFYSIIGVGMVIVLAPTALYCFYTYCPSCKLNRNSPEGISMQYTTIN